jgi:uncharacterized protein
MKSHILLALALGALLINTSLAAPLKVLVVTGGHDFEKEQFFKVFKDNTDITFTNAVQVKSSEAYDRDDLLSYDVIVLYDMVQKITDEQKKKLLSIFDKGIGFVVTHHAVCSYQDWPEWEHIRGGKYLLKDETVDGKAWPKSDYKHDVDLPVTIADKEHPITAGVSDFTIHDEIYTNFRLQPDVKPLLTTTHPQSTKTLGWWRMEKKSKVVYLELGHDHQSYENPNYQKLLRQAIRWSAQK